MTFRKTNDRFAENPKVTQEVAQGAPKEAKLPEREKPKPKKPKAPLGPPQHSSMTGSGSGVHKIRPLKPRTKK